MAERDDNPAILGILTITVSRRTEEGAAKPDTPRSRHTSRQHAPGQGVSTKKWESIFGPQGKTDLKQ